MKVFIFLFILVSTPSILYATEKHDFSQFLKHFQKINLPITITKTNYTSFFGDKISDTFLEKFFGICCPETITMANISANRNYVAVLYCTVWSEFGVTIRTFTHDGKMISVKTIARFEMETGDPTNIIHYKKITISKNHHITIDTDHIYSDIDHKNNKLIEKKMINKIIKLYIDENGNIHEQ